MQALGEACRARPQPEPYTLNSLYLDQLGSYLDIHASPYCLALVLRHTSRRGAATASCTADVPSLSQDSEQPSKLQAMKGMAGKHTSLIS